MNNVLDNSLPPCVSTRYLAVGETGAANQDVEQTFHEVEKFKKRDRLVEILGQKGSWLLHRA